MTGYGKGSLNVEGREYQVEIKSVNHRYLDINIKIPRTLSYLEETGKKIEIKGYVATIENFFEMNNQKYHEIMFIHKAEFVNEEDKILQETIKNIEGKDFLQYDWVDLDKIDEYPIMPKVIKEILKEKIYPVHKINDELK